MRCFGLIAIEDLHIKNMSRSAKGTVDQPGRNVRQKAGLNRPIAEHSWGVIRQQLSDKVVSVLDVKVFQPMKRLAAHTVQTTVFPGAPRRSTVISVDCRWMLTSMPQSTS